MPMNVTRYGVAPYAVGAGINSLDQATANAAGVSVSGQVQVTGVILLAILLAVVVIARAFGGFLE